MSRIGVQPVKIEDGTQIDITDRLFTAKGQHGELSIDIPRTIRVEKVDNEIIVKRNSDKKKNKSLHGLIRSLINNAVIGVNKPWEKTLEVVGTGYKVKAQGQDLVLEVGLSHSVTFEHVDGVNFAVKGNKITVSGVDKQLVGEVANKIKLIRKPDPYKGKGVRYEGEVLHLKPGKKAKTAE